MSPLPFELALALRYLRPKRTFVSIITLICIIGVMLGVAVLIIVIAVMTGFGEQLRENIVGFSAHIRVEREGSAMPAWSETMAKIEKIPLIRGVAPYVNSQVIMETQPVAGPSRKLVPLIRGIDPLREGLVTQLTNSIVLGKFDLTPNSLLVGIDMAESLEVHVGDKLAVYSLPAIKRMYDAYEKGRAREIAVAQNFVVKGIFDAGLYDLNNNIMVTGLGDAQDLQGLDDQITGLSVMLHDASPANTEAARARIEKALGPDFKVNTWLSDNKKFLGALAVEKNMMFYLLFFIVLVAAFGIMSALITFVVQKTREIGVLKAVGATEPQIAGIFMMQGLVVGVIGVLTGLALGLIALHFRNGFLDFMNRRLHLELFPPEIYQFRSLPCHVVISDVAIICGGSLIICLLAAVVPALRAAWLQPVQALRHE